MIMHHWVKFIMVKYKIWQMSHLRIHTDDLLQLHMCQAILLINMSHPKIKKNLRQVTVHLEISLLPAARCIIHKRFYVFRKCQHSQRRELWSQPNTCLCLWVPDEETIQKINIDHKVYSDINKILSCFPPELSDSDFILLNRNASYPRE